jgi:hypothetical protein
VIAIDYRRALRQFHLAWDLKMNMRGRMESRRAVSDCFTLVLGM